MLKDNQTRIVEQSRPQEKSNNGSPTDDRRGQPAKKSSSSQWIIIGIVCVIAAVTVLWLLHRREVAKAAAAAKSKASGGPVPVVAGTVTQKNVSIYLDGLGTVQAYYTVTVHSRVDGELKQVAYVEGQDVHKGDLLAQIDPAPYQATLDQAIGLKGKDEAQLANAQLDLKRESNLYEAKIDTQQAYATQKALVDQLTAAVKADQAAIESAQVNLDYSKIVSPIEGRTGIRPIDPGNIVHATDSNGVAVVTQVKPISVVFTLPEQTLGEIHKQMGTSGTLTVLAVDRDNNATLGQGELAVIDNQIDTSTGTIKLKANFPNDNLALWPGQFVNARLLLITRTNGVVVPAAAVQRGPDGAYVFVVVDHPVKTNAQNNSNQAEAGGKNANPSGESEAEKPGGQADNKKKGGKGGGGNGGNGPVFYVTIRPVKVAQIEAGDALIDSGLQPGDRIVVDGQYKLQDGSQIKLATEKDMESSGSGNSDTSGGKGGLE